MRKLFSFPSSFYNSCCFWWEEYTRTKIRINVSVLLNPIADIFMGEKKKYSAILEFKTHSVEKINQNPSVCLWTINTVSFCGIQECTPNTSSKLDQNKIHRISLDSKRCFYFPEAKTCHTFICSTPSPRERICHVHAASAHWGNNNF